MARYTVEIVRGGTLDTLIRGLKVLRGILVRIGALITNRSQQTFDQQGQNRVGKVNAGSGIRPGSFPWEARANPNIPGIIQDLQRGTNVPSRRYDDRPAVMDKGRLRASINWHILDASTVEIGTNIPYASDQQFGADRDIPVGPVVHGNLGKYLRRNPQRRPQLGWLFGESMITWHIIPRPFVLIDEADKKDINRIVYEGLAA